MSTIMTTTVVGRNIKAIKLVAFNRTPAGKTRLRYRLLSAANPPTNNPIIDVMSVASSRGLELIRGKAVQNADGPIYRLIRVSPNEMSSELKNAAAHNALTRDLPSCGM
jgi:hypothetical protein